jgi:hypothetical protein
MGKKKNNFKKRVYKKKIYTPPILQPGKYCSIDVGSINCGLSVVDVISKTDWKIKRWECVDFIDENKGLGNEYLANKVKKSLDDRPVLLSCRCLLIERQMKSKMTILQNVIMMWFLMHGISVKVVDPSIKLAHLGGSVTGKKNYGLRKEKSEEEVECILDTKFGEDNKYIQFLNINTKKDDLCDSLLQLIKYLGLE